MPRCYGIACLILLSTYILQAVYKQHDTDNSGHFCRAELREALRSVGYSVSNATFSAIVCRYSDRDGYIRFDDFVECLVKLTTMIGTINYFFFFSVILFITVRKRSLGKGNTFSSVCQEFCSQGGVPGQVHPHTQVTHPRAGTPPSGQVLPLGRYTPPRNSACWEIRATSWLYTSYWSAFLFIFFWLKNLRERYFSLDQGTEMSNFIYN